jgi:hypothetical protein
MPNRLLSFPNPVNEVASRVVAGGVVGVSLVAILAQQPWLSAVLAYGFLARLASGPTLSPLGQIATRLVAPRIAAHARLVPGPPKRFAQGLGAAITVAATLLFFIWHLEVATYTLLGLLVVAAFLEAALGLCIGCRIFSVLIRAGVVPPAVCLACANLESRDQTA